MTPHDVYATPMAPNHVLYTSYLWERAGVRERARRGARCTSKEGLSHGVAPNRIDDSRYIAHLITQKGRAFLCQLTQTVPCP